MLVPGLCCATVGVAALLPEDPDDDLKINELKGKVVCQGKIVEGKTPAKKRAIIANLVIYVRNEHTKQI